MKIEQNFRSLLARSALDDAFAHFFESLGYNVGMEGRIETGERWHEISDDTGLICQVSFGTPLAEFLTDLPHLVDRRSGVGGTDYWCACPDDVKLRALLARVKEHEAAYD